MRSRADRDEFRWDVAQLDHPCIVSIHDFGRHGGSLFFVIEDNIGQKQALSVLDNPTLTGEAKPVDLFTATEDMDTQEALAVWKRSFVS